jgi:hypothetical protein
MYFFILFLGENLKLNDNDDNDNDGDNDNKMERLIFPCF